MLWRFLGVLLLLQVGLPLLLLAFRNRILFFPSARPTTEEGLPQLAGVDARLVTVTRPDGRTLTGYDARPAGAPDTPVLLYLHGNAGNAAHRARWLRWLVHETGLRIVLASYSGYGGNGGSPSEEDLRADALAFHDHLTASGVDPRSIVVYGESIGGAPALQLAVERPSAGVIVQSTLSSLSSMAWHVHPWLPLTSLLARGMFPNAERAAALDVPLLIVHGTADRIIPFEEAEALRAAAPGADVLPISGAGHNDLFDVGGPAYAAEIARRVRLWTDRP